MRNHRFLIDHLASVYSRFGEEIYSWSFPFDTVDLIVTSSTKDIKIDDSRYLQAL